MSIGFGDRCVCLYVGRGRGREGRVFGVQGWGIMTEDKKQRRVGERRTSAQRLKRVLAETTPKHLEQLTKQARAFAGDDEQGLKKSCLEDIHARLSSLKGRHATLRQNLTFLKVNGIHDQLMSEAGLVAGEQLDGDAWNDDVIAAVQERSLNKCAEDAMEPSLVTLDEKGEDGSVGSAFHVTGKVICGLKGGRVCIRYDTSYAGTQYESYFCVLATKPSSARLYVSEHSVPFFLPLREVEKAHLSFSATKFIDYLSDVLQAYVSRREQVAQFKEMMGDQIRELYHSLSYNLIELLLEEPHCRIWVSLAYDDLQSDLPTRSAVLAWPNSPIALPKISQRGISFGSPHRLLRTECALRSMRLPQGYEVIIADLEDTLGTCWFFGGAEASFERL